MEDFFREWSYLAVALYLWGTGFGLPFPEDVCLILAGWLCKEEYASLWIMLPVCIVCVFGSDCVIYVIGRRYGHHVPNWPLINRMLTPEKLEKAEKLYHTHGGKTLFAARFLPFVRASTFFVGGTFKYPFWKFCLYDGGAAVLSVPVFVLLGWFFADQLDNLKVWMQSGKNIAIAATILAIVAYVVWYIWRKKKKARLAAQDDSTTATDDADNIADQATGATSTTNPSNDGLAAALTSEANANSVTATNDSNETPSETDTQAGEHTAGTTDDKTGKPTGEQPSTVNSNPPT